MLTCPSCSQSIAETGSTHVQCGYCGAWVQDPATQEAGYDPASEQPPGYQQDRAPPPRSQPPAGPYPGGPQPYPGGPQPYQGGSAPYPSYGPGPLQGFVIVGGGEAISGAMGIYKRHFGSFLGFWLLAVAINALISAVQGSLEITDYVPYMALSILSGCISLLFSAGIIAMTKEAMTTGKTSIKDGFDIIGKKGGTIIITSLVVGLLVAIGTILCIIPGIVLCYWYFFAVTLVVVEGCSVGEALSGSKRFSQDHGTFGFILLLILFFAMIYITGFLVSFVVAIYVSGDLFVGLIISIVVVTVLSLLVSPLLYISIAYYYVKGTGRLQETPVNY